jgi:hypothetical protein
MMALPLAAGCARQAPIEKTLVVTLPPRHVPGSLRLSEDGTAYAFIEETPTGQRVVSSAGTGETHSACLRLSFAPKTNRLFYWTRDDSGPDKVFAIVADGKAIPTGFAAAGEVSFSEDGSHWTAIGAEPSSVIGQLGEMLVTVDGEQLTRQRDMGLPVFSPDGAHVAFLARTDNSVSLFIDGVERQGFGVPTAPCAAAALQAAPHPDVSLRHVVRYFADGSLLVMTRDADGWGVYHDGLRIASYPVSNIDRFDENCATAAVLAPFSFRKAENAPAGFWWERVAGDAELWRVVRNGQPVDDVMCVEPWRRHPPEPSVDGRHVVYGCRSKNPDDMTSVFLVKDGARLGPYQDLWGIAPSKDGAHVSYGAQGTEETRPWSMYVDGEARFQHLSATWRPRVTEDGAILAWEGKRDEESRGLFGINGRVVGSFDDVLWGPEFHDRDRVAWIVRRGRKITRISVPFAAATAFYALMSGGTLGICALVALLYFGHRGAALPRQQFRITGDWLMERDDEIGFRPRHNGATEVLHLDNGQHFHLFTDGRGARVNAAGAQTPAPVDVMAVGCSFTWGPGVESELTYTQQLGRLLDVPVANFGMGSYGSVQAFQTLVRNADLQPRVVVYGFIQDHLRRNVSPCAPNYVPYCLPVSYLRRDGDWIAIQRPHMEYFSPEDNGAFNTEVVLRDPSGPLAWLLGAKWAAKMAVFQYRHPETIAVDTSPETASVAIATMIRAMVDETERIGAHLVVLNLPYLPRGRQQPVPPALAAAVAGRDLTFVDFTPVAVDYYAQHATGTLTLDDDPHPNATAHRLIAETLVPVVKPLLAAPSAAVGAS